MVDYRVTTVMTGDKDFPAQIDKLVRNGGLDLLVAADAGRLGRGVAATYLFGMAIGQGTRVLLCDDSVDTAFVGLEPSWPIGWMARPKSSYRAQRLHGAAPKIAEMVNEEGTRNGGPPPMR